jgi:hypothetical protein
MKYEILNTNFFLIWRTTVTGTPGKRNDQTQDSLRLRESPKNYYK